MTKIKKRLLSISIATIGIIIVILTLCFTLFIVRDVKIEFASTTSKLSGKENEIVKSGKFGMGSCIFFQWKAEYTARIEKEFPYAKVINIESIIPWTLVVHMAEREEYFEFEDAGKLVVTDQSLKVLRVENSIPAESENIRLKNIQILSSDKLPGTFLQTDANIIKNLASALFENNRLIYEQKGMFARIEAGIRREPTTKQNEIFLKFIDRGGFEIIIYNSEYKLKEKLQKMLGALPIVTPSEREAKYMEIGDLFDGGTYWLLK